MDFIRASPWRSPITHRASGWLAPFGAALEPDDHDAVAAMFDDDAFRRDPARLTWSIKTMKRKAAIRAMLDATAAQRRLQ